MRAIRFALFALLLFATTMQGQDATVTFYAHQPFLAGYPKTQHALFYGRVYDDSHFLFTFHTGVFVKNNRFVTLRLSPGQHTFTASYDRDPAKSKTHLPLTLEAGKTYFLRAQSDQTDYLAFSLSRGRLDLISCEAAHQEAGNAKPLPPSIVDPSISAKLVVLEVMPPCP